MEILEPIDTPNTSDTSDETRIEAEKTTLFTATEARVLACLMEKELTVPDNYPLTLNSLTLACNQKSNRDPQMNIPEGEVGHTAKTLQDRDFAKIEYGERAHRFEHTARKAFDLNKRQQALLTVMMLRAPQTINDLKVRTKRMVDFSDNDDILLTLNSMNERDDAMVLHIPKGAGQREDRYTHLLCGKVEISAQPNKIAPVFTPPVDENKLAELEAQIAALTARVEALELG